MFYEINVSLNGMHLFATAERSATSEDKMKVVYKEIHERFPSKEGYKVTVTKWNSSGTRIENPLL